MKLTKIDAMHSVYGKGKGYCGNCGHFMDKKWGWTKCAVYGVTSSHATDWSGNYEACGLTGKPFPEEDRRIHKLYISVDDTNEPIEGQLSFDI